MDKEPSQLTPDDPVAADLPKPEEGNSSVQNTAVESHQANLVVTQQLITRPSQSRWARLKHNYSRHKKLTIPLTAVLLLLLVCLLPQTRYQILGLFWTQKYQISLTDSVTRQPISAARVSMAGKTVITDNKGKATVAAKVGHQELSIQKQYYAVNTSQVLVPLRVKDTISFTLKASGRQVPLVLVNKITGKPVENATVKAAKTEARTDKNGKVTMVLPADKTTIAATISGSGYNDREMTIQVTTEVVKANSFQLTPSGKIYFLSKLSGKVDVVKTNLDGTSRQVVLPASGFEEDRGTVLLSSRDWKYLALYSIRTSDKKAEINLIDTTNGDKLVNIDKGKASFSLIGWEGNYFNYLVYRNDVKNWESNAAVIKSYNASSGKIAQLDGTTAEGNSDDNARYESLSTSGIYLVGGKLVYSKLWYAYPGYLSVPGKQNTLSSINPDGSGKKVISSIDAGTSYFSNFALYEPEELIINVFSSANNSPPVSYQYMASGSYTKRGEDTSTKSASDYPTYLVSPSGNQTFWSELRDGKNTLFTGDKAGQDTKQIATLSDYKAYGWYSDNYVLVSKNGSELYILPANGGTALKVTDYHKSDQTFQGYGGGYGGL